MSGTIHYSLRPWHLANTTLRNPLRLQFGLQALVDSGFEGRMGKDQEESIARALDHSGVITLSPKTKDVTSISRKWRSALGKLGFITPDYEKIKELKNVSEEQVEAELGGSYKLTANGKRLLAAQSLQAQQEVFLRAMAALQLPSPLEDDYKFGAFFPLRHIIHILERMEQLGIESYISRLEMASLIIFTYDPADIDEICDKIRRLRSDRANATSKRKFDAETMEKALQRQLDQGAKNKNYNTYYDYQDVSFRYLKGTGLFQSKGRGIALVPEKKKFARLIADGLKIETDPVEYLKRLSNGASLPIDDLSGSRQVLNDLIRIAKTKNLVFDSSAYDLATVAGMQTARYDLDALIFEDKEQEYANRQVHEIDEISAYLKMLDENKTTLEFGEDELKIPKEERAAYLEWILWRVILAFNHLAIAPSKVRRFHIDQDFLPIGTASGGGADIVAEYDDTVVVIEVTLTESSRQEAAEGEPVRRHVADVLVQHKEDGKNVLGLFVARNIDTNAAETFRVGTWYLSDNEKVRLNIAPVTLGQLRRVVERAAIRGNLSPRVLFELVHAVLEIRDTGNGAPEWKHDIENFVSNMV